MAYLRKRVRKDGKVRWEIVISMGRDPQRLGKYRQKSIVVEGTRAEALRRAVELEREKESGVSLDARKLTVAEYLRRWLRHVRLSPSTYERYAGVVEQHLIPDIGSIPLAKLTPLHIQEMYDRQLEQGRKDNKRSVGRSLAPSTVAYYHRVLRRALKQAVKWRLIPSNPCDRGQGSTCPRCCTSGSRGSRCSSLPKPRPRGAPLTWTTTPWRYCGGTAGSS